MLNVSLKKFSGIKKTNLFLAGGIFANIKLNQKISNLENVKYCYVFPNMGDGGLGAGCAFWMLILNITICLLKINKQCL